jgi:DNA polymerase-3 subunit chi
MTEVRFYHLLTRTVDQALPEILQKGLGAGHRIVVRTRDDAEAEKLAAHLWTFREDSFLPHGTKKDGHADKQPIWITPGTDTPNSATMAVILNGAPLEPDAPFTLCCDLFDGNDEAATAAARVRWKTYKDLNFSLAYWQQTDKGWVQKA